MFGFITRRIDTLKTITVETTNETLEAVFKFVLLCLSIFTIVWISIFLYVAFYYTYVPSIEHVKVANLEFNPCEGHGQEKSVCSFPRAHISLTKTNQLLMVGQPYQISVLLEVPESDENRSLGMFLICGQLFSKDGVVIAHSCRSTMLRYHSPLLKAFKILALSGFYMMNFIEEKQVLEVELFSNFKEDQNFPVTDMHIELKSEKVQVYSAKMRIDAHLTGLRYLMFHWPTSSAMFGVTFNIIVILFIAVLSWWQIYGPYNVTGREFLFNKLKEKLSYKSRVKTKNGILAPLGHYKTNGKTLHELTGKDVDSTEMTGFLKLKDDFEEEEEDRERKFILERKSSSSEA